MKLENIGFYTLSDQRAKSSSAHSRMMRAELLLGAQCNFSCPYCRGVGGRSLSLEEGFRIIDLWCKDNLFAIRFSGGEPLLNRHLVPFVQRAREGGVERIAISSNGSAPTYMYQELIEEGVNDFSISLDACCAEDGEKMSGGRKGAWEKVISNIETLSKLSYVTVGVVLTEHNADKVPDIIRFADSLGVSDIRIIPAAQRGATLPPVHIEKELEEKYPILAYRLRHLREGVPVRGISTGDNNRCPLVLDDMAVMEGKHYPCIIYMREGGSPIGKVGPEMRKERELWALNHDTHQDKICSQNCLDVCVHYNNTARDR